MRAPAKAAVLGAVLAASTIAAFVALRKPGLPSVRVSCLGSPPIPGPDHEPLGKHIADVILTGREPDEVCAHPQFGRTLTPSKLTVLFSRQATVEQANLALCEAGVKPVSVMASINTVVVQLSQNRDLARLQDVRARLVAHKGVEAVALDFASGGPDAVAPVCSVSHVPKMPCPWAGEQVIAKYPGMSPASCSAERYDVNGKETYVAVIRPDDASLLIAIVDDEGVYPMRFTAPAESAPNNALGMDRDELATQKSRKLTGLAHASQRTRIGRYAVALAQHDADGSVPAPKNPFNSIRDELRIELAALDRERIRCLDAFIREKPSRRGGVVHVHFRIHPDGHVSDVQATAPFEQGRDFADSEAPRCLVDAVRAIHFAPHGDEDIFELVEVYPVEPSPTYAR